MTDDPLLNRANWPLVYVNEVTTGIHPALQNDPALMTVMSFAICMLDDPKFLPARVEDLFKSARATPTQAGLNKLSDELRSLTVRGLLVLRLERDGVERFSPVEGLIEYGTEPLP